MKFIVLAVVCLLAVTTVFAASAPADSTLQNAEGMLAKVREKITEYSKEGQENLAANYKKVEAAVKEAVDKVKASTGEQYQAATSKLQSVMESVKSNLSEVGSKVDTKAISDTISNTAAQATSAFSGLMKSGNRK